MQRQLLTTSHVREDVAGNDSGCYQVAYAREEGGQERVFGQQIGTSSDLVSRWRTLILASLLPVLPPSPISDKAPIKFTQTNVIDTKCKWLGGISIR